MTATVRAERQAQTRQRVLEAAERLFLTRGFGGTSLEDVASEAGFSKGAVYSNFAGKNDLFFAIVERQFGDLAEQLKAAVRAEPLLVGRLAAVTRWYEDYLQVESAWIRSLPELMAVATQDPEAHRRVSELLHEIEVALADLLQEQQDAMGVRFALPPTTIAALAVSMVVGLTVRTVHDLDGPDPRAGTTHFTNAMSVLLQLAPT